MSDSVRFLRLGRLPWRTTQAFYHAVADCMKEGTPDTLIFAVPDEPYFCIGYHQNPSDFLDVTYCRRRGLGILRRRLGGGAVFLDSDQFFFQCVFHRSRVPARVDALFRMLLTPPVAALKGMGFDAELEGINEITVGGRRISGTGAGWIGEASVVVGNVLVDFPCEEMVRAWNLPSKIFRRLASEGLQVHLTTLRRESETPPSMDAIEEHFFNAYTKALSRPLVEGALTHEELKTAGRLETELTDPHWLEEHPVHVGRKRLKIARGVYICETMFQTESAEAVLTARINRGIIEALEIHRPGQEVVNGNRNCAIAGARSRHPKDMARAVVRFSELKYVEEALEVLAHETLREE